MDIRPDQLEQQGYSIKDRLDHKELIPFINMYLKKKTKYLYLYIFFNAFFLLWLVYSFVRAGSGENYTYFDLLLWVSYGITLTFLWVPLHEYIHVLAYRSKGAQETSYDVNWKKLYFLAIADRFVANKKEFEWIALAPFVVISSLMLMLWFVVGGPWQVTVATMLFFHAAMCSGDFGLLSYFEYHSDVDVVTYDDKKERASYFFSRPHHK